MRPRNTFHENASRHYKIMLDNAREDGHDIGYAGYKRASKKTLKELGLAHSDEMARLLRKLNPGARAKLQLLFG